MHQSLLDLFPPVVGVALAFPEAFKGVVDVHADSLELVKIVTHVPAGDGVDDTLLLGS